MWHLNIPEIYITRVSLSEIPKHGEDMTLFLENDPWSEIKATKQSINQYLNSK